MPRFFTMLMVMMLYLISSTSSAQHFDSFRLVGDVPAVAAGSVTSIELPDSEGNAGKISFINAAGLSTIYVITLRQSEVIGESMPVYMPPVGFSTSDEPSMDLSGVQFFTARLSDPENAEVTPPLHWFRLTLHDGIWSGTFRIANRLYSIDRLQREPVIAVRAAQTDHTALQPGRQVKLSALIDDAFVFADSPGDSIGMDSKGHVFALESLHVMDGLLVDSLGMTLKLDQLIYRHSSELSSDNSTEAIAVWLSNNEEAFGLSDNLATFTFRGNEVQNATESNFVTLGKSNNYQFVTARLFGEFLGLPEQQATLQSRNSIFPVAHWSSEQRQYLNDNPPSASLVQTISYDEPEIEITTTDAVNPIPQHILDSEIVETSEINGLQSDSIANPSAAGQSGGNGGGLFNPVPILVIALLACATRRRFSTDSQMLKLNL